MKANTSNGTAEVEAWLSALEHPLKKEIAEVRNIIIRAHPKIRERIKWAAPSFYAEEDMVTFNHRNQKAVHLVFHHPAIVAHPSTLLNGNYKDRRMIYFSNAGEIKAARKELQAIMQFLVRSIETTT